MTTAIPGCSNSLPFIWHGTSMASSSPMMARWKMHWYCIGLTIAGHTLLRISQITGIGGAAKKPDWWQIGGESCRRPAEMGGESFG